MLEALLAERELHVRTEKAPSLSEQVQCLNPVETADLLNVLARKIRGDTDTATQAKNNPKSLATIN